MTDRANLYQLDNVVQFSHNVQIQFQSPNNPSYMARSATSDDSKSHFATPKEYYNFDIPKNRFFIRISLLCTCYLALNTIYKRLLAYKKEAFFCDLRLFLYICASSLSLCHLIRHIIFLSAYMTDEHLNKRGDTT